MSTATADVREPGLLRAPGLSRIAPLSGMAFVVFFIGGVVASNAPADDASNATWIAAYRGDGNEARHLATGILLVLAALSLLSFLTVLWTRVAQARRPESPSPLPLVAAGAGAACIAVGGVLMGTISGSSLISSSPAPSVDLLRFANDAGFAMVSIGGMLAIALAVACLSLQARRAGVFGRGLTIFGIVVAVSLLAAVLFIPIAVLLVWLVVTAVALVRTPPRRGAEAA